MVQLTPDDITDTAENELWEGLACYEFSPRIFEHCFFLFVCFMFFDFLFFFPQNQ